MAKKLFYECNAWFNGWVKAVAFPNSARLADHLEISRKQVQREVRDYAGYNAFHKGETAVC